VLHWKFEQTYQFHKTNVFKDAVPFLLFSRKLQKEVKVLKKKLSRSEANRVTLEEMWDRNSKLFQVLNENLDRAQKELEIQRQQTLEKFVPAQFIKRIESGNLDDVALGKGSSDNLTILFSDIRSFTAYSETMSPEQLFAFLNEYLKIMNDQIHHNSGFIDKFIGDAIMVLFDHLEKSNQMEAQHAVKAAIDMQIALKEYNLRRNKQGHQSIQTGIGILSGSVMIGTIGSEERMDFTVLGDNVNLASRIESLTKQYGAGILISDAL